MTLLTKQELDEYNSMIPMVGLDERKKIRQILEMDKVERCRESFIFFVSQMWDGFISGKHHQIMADAFERVAKGELKRLIINMPPRHTKSEFASYLLPAWFLGLHPEKKIIQTAHTAELATGFGRKVRNLVQSPVYDKVFSTKLSSDSKAAGRWNTNAGGDYFAIGVGGAVTGKGADLLIIDDPHSEQEAKQNNPAVFDGVYEWYTSGPRQRLQPGGSIIIVMCMTGDTNVLMANGTTQKLKDIKVGDYVATFDNGKLSTSKVNNWRSSGVDSIYKIQTQSGIMLRANERHPFLVMNEGVLEWTRLNQLRVGDLLVSLKDAIDRQGQKQNPATERRQAYLKELHRISDFTVDQIVSITPDGEEEVFDVEIDKTENFIANGVVSHNTRWAKRDLTGQILKNSEKDGVDGWEIIEFPAILPSGTPLWPAFWKREELEAIKAEIPTSKWNAQYQQNPTSEEGAIIKREYWRMWQEPRPPACEFVIQSWDTAFEKNNRADYSALTIWGVFQHPDEKGNYKTNIIVLDSFKKRMEFPELKAAALQYYKEWNPDLVLIEKKAAGAPLIYELKNIGVPIQEYTPSKGSDKIARVNAVSPLFEAGIVWCPDTRWADELMEECASFPNGDHDDLVDSTSQALLRFRQGGFISIESDEPDEQIYFKGRRSEKYYTV
jgi:predicted phage terminase large subunit-like protein